MDAKAVSVKGKSGINSLGENVRGRCGRVCLEGGKCGQIYLKGVREHNDNSGGKQNGSGEHNSGDKHNGGSDGYSEKEQAMVIRRRKG